MQVNVGHLADIVGLLVLANIRIRPGEYMVDGERGVGQAMGFGRRRRRLA